MFHSHCLNVIGHALETAGILTFKINKDRDVYRLCLGHVVFVFDLAAVSRLSAIVPKTQPNMLTGPMRFAPSLSEQMRRLGDYLERFKVDEFRIVWTRNFVIVDYENLNGQATQRVFTSEQIAAARPLGETMQRYPNAATLAPCLVHASITKRLVVRSVSSSAGIGVED